MPSTETVGPADAWLTDAAYFFRADDGSVLALFAVELADGMGERGGVAEETVVALTVEDRTAAPRAALPPQSLRLEPAPPPSAPNAYFGKTYLTGGTSYAVRFAVAGGGRPEVRVRERRLTVPELSGFAASSVVPAERFGPASPEADARFIVGSEEVLPRPGGVFRRGELLRLYLQVYGAAIDPATSMPRVDVSFRFTCDGRRRSRSIRSPFRVDGASGASMGLALPIGDWPVGTYRVDVDLKDRVGGSRAAASGRFSIAGR